MKAYIQFFVGIVLIGSLALSGCSSDSPSSATMSGGVSRLEGQLVSAAEQSAKSTSHQARSLDLVISPLRGATVTLSQNGVVLATALTDEYGRFQFNNLDAGQYILQVISDTVYQYQVSLDDGNTLTVYGKVTSTGKLEWEEESGSSWDEMQSEEHWKDTTSSESLNDDSSDDTSNDSSSDDSSNDDSSDDSSNDDSSDDSSDDDSSDDSSDDDSSDDSSDDDSSDDSSDDDSSDDSSDDDNSNDD